ncbi:hypothetical protein LEP1GSC148_2860 [Leptospira interrogans serovar Canicola str. LT1962]|nr:hypothetical protein LEP1GSC148_2860 [Leptospira interrogans serovar Canicola str. LT1962]
MTSFTRIDRLKRRAEKLNKLHDKISVLLSRLSLFRLIFFPSFYFGFLFSTIYILQFFIIFLLWFFFFFFLFCSKI